MLAARVETESRAGQRESAVAGRRRTPARTAKQNKTNSPVAFSPQPPPPPPPPRTAHKSVCSSSSASPPLSAVDARLLRRCTARTWAPGPRRRRAWRASAAADRGAGERAAGRSTGTPHITLPPPSITMGLGR